MFCLCFYHVNKVNYADNCSPRMSLKPHVYWTFSWVFSICCITISFWVVTKVVVKSSFELKRVRWPRKFARLMHFFEIDVAECNLKPSTKRFKTFGIQKIASSAHNFLYFSMKVAIYNRCELRMTHERKSARSVSCFARGDCLHFAFLAKIRCKHGAFQSVW